METIDCFYIVNDSPREDQFIIDHRGESSTVMAFIDTKDPKERYRLVADYLATVKNIQRRNEDEKALGLKRQVDLETAFNPVVNATEVYKGDNQRVGTFTRRNKNCK